MLVGCQQEDLLQSAQEEGKTHQRNQSQSRMVEGLIPFTVDNVQAALPIVLTYYRTNRPIVAEKFAHYQVEPTHVYYKFMPQDSIQQARLMEAEDVLQLTTSPLEFSRTERTEDPVEDEIPVYYGIAKYNAAVPDVPHDVIAKLHFTDEDRLEDMQANYDEIEFKQNLMYETRKIAGHLDDEELNEGYMNYEEGIQDKNNGSGAASRLFAKKWRPSGNIRVEEDIVRTNNSSKNHYEGVKRATVNVLKWGWLQVEQGTTDGNGYFSTGTTYTKNVHYKVKFKHDYVTVKEGNFYNTADYFSGEHKRAPLNITFMKDGPLSHYHFFALVHNASYDYYNRCLSKFGLHNPGKLNITALYYGSNSNSGAQWYPFNSAIRVSRSSSGFYRGSDGIYATTVHELTHNSQRKMDPGMFSLLYSGNKQRKLMIESWAEGVETIVTNDRYTSMFSSNGYGVYRSSTRGTHASTLVWNGLRQHQSISDMNAYTPLVIDLVDNFNQSLVLNNPNIPNERVYGYTLAQIQTALNTSRTLDQWKGRLESLYSNSTEPMLGDVFGYAQTVLSNSANWTD
ncbi:hypothetical protein DRF67_20260 [Chryseobacterium pennipullorum]|uniref:Uncharacterized protein n=2 Tax=Chryseobacterium pennipullorum TaxID=2258963 RepID=A0A3D9AMY5_9FLAO|nr:hypothetical protein DRF67_20260 [Chryseobacterium pennipullorum]